MQDIITNLEVFDLQNAIRAAKFPMSVDVESVTDTMTVGIHRLGLNPAGSGHSNWLSGILVSFDLTCTNKMWVEFERYHFAQIVSSQSTMHRITRFDLDNAFIEYTDPVMIDILKGLVQNYNNEPTLENYLRVLYSTPSGLKLTARVTTNYLQLKTMYAQRHDHRLPEWREFCRYIKENLPYSEFITGEVQE